MSDTSAFGLKEAFEVYSTHRGAILQMLSFYSAGTLAVLGYTIGAEKATRRWPEVLAILAGYLVFAIGNAWAVVLSQEELTSFAKGIDVLLTKRPELKPHFSVLPIESWKLIAFYVVVTTAVCAGIVAKYLYKVARARSIATLHGQVDPAK